MSKLLLAFVITVASFGWSQTATPQTPRPGTQAGSSAGAEKSTAPRPQRGAMGQGKMQMEQNMRSMQNDLVKMRSLLAQMKTNAVGMTGNNRSAMEANIQLWQMMVDHMSQMVEHMSSMQSGSGMGMGKSGGCPCMKSGMAGDKGGSGEMGCCCGGGGNGMSCGTMKGQGANSGMSHDMSGMQHDKTLEGPALAAPSVPNPNNPPMPPKN